MNDERVCRRCLLIQSGRGDVLDDIKRRIEKLSESERAQKEIYESRLNTCSQCGFLADGTCLKCGCYPEFRAAFSKKKCPEGKW